MESNYYLSGESQNSMVFNLPKDNLYWSYGSLSVACVIYLSIWVYSYHIPHFANQFFERDPSLSYYNRSADIVSTTMLYQITLSISLAILCIASIFSLKAEKVKFYFGKNQFGNEAIIQRLNFFVLFGLGLACAIFTAEATNNIIKNRVGRPRPDAFYLCNYKGYADAVNSGNYATYDSLTTTNAEGFVSNCYSSYHDAWSAFPSGHSSMSGATMTFSTLLLRSLLEIDDNVYVSFKNLIAFSPTVVAAWICVSRLIDRKHHPDDVIGGYLIGVVCACMAYCTVNDMFKRCIKFRDDNDDILIDRVRSSNFSASGNVLHSSDKL